MSNADPLIFNTARQKPLPAVKILSGPYSGQRGVIVDRDPKWSLVRLTDGVWPFPVDVWVHRRDLEALAPADRLADLGEALV
jgi:hypothetical protein